MTGLSERFREDVRVQLAGSISAFFHLDPIAVLSSDYFEWNVRLAAFNHAVEERNKAYEEANSKRKK